MRKSIEGNDLIMGMPQIPPAEHRPTLCQTRIDLLEAVALDTMSAAHILNAQGEQNQAVVQHFADGDLSFCQLQQNCRCTRALLQSLIMKDWLHQQKLAAISELCDPANDTPCCPPEQPCPPPPVCPPPCPPTSHPPCSCHYPCRYPGCPLPYCGE